MVDGGVEAEHSSLSTAQTTSCHPYPPPLATYDEVVASPDLFIDTLKKLHLSMTTKFMKPIVGGKDLDLHRLFVQVTSRGGIAKVLGERRWKEVTAVFNFPSSATNASFILRKYYFSLLYHYEQIYFLNAKFWNPSPIAMQQLSATTPPPEYMPSLPQRNHTASPQDRPNTSSSTPMPQVSLAAPSAGAPVCGVIDGKFDCGYFVTVRIGSEEFRGVLYQVPSTEKQISPGGMQAQQHQSLRSMNYYSSVQAGSAPRRKRRKKSEIRRRDPAHPKPNRSGYNFFFAEQHARLKPHYHGKDREISRIIGESWNKLQEPDRAVYQEKALRDKERYQNEMEVYRERLRSGQVIGSVAPLEQRTPVPLANLTDLNSNAEFEGSASACAEENDRMSSEKSYSEEEYDKEGLDFGEYSQAAAAAADMELKNVNIEVVADDAFDRAGHETTTTTDKYKTTLSSGNNDGGGGDDGISVPVEEVQHQHAPSIDVNQSVSSL